MSGTRGLLDLPREVLVQYPALHRCATCRASRARAGCCTPCARSTRGTLLPTRVVACDARFDGLLDQLMGSTEWAAGMRLLRGYPARS